MATKKEIVKEILSIEEIDTESNLMKKNLKELTSILSELKKENSIEVKEVSVESTVPTQELDIEAIKAQLEKELREKILSELKEENESSTPEEKPYRRVEIDRYEPIPVMNATSGQLVFISNKTGIEYNWEEYGDVEYLEYQELLTMRSGHKKFLHEPYIIILHDDAVNNLGLTKMYENLIDLDDIESIFKLPLAKFKEVIDSSPRGVVHTIITKARKLHSQGKLDSISKVNYLNEKFNTDIGQRVSDME